jgi:hypothetical protein
MRPDENVVMGRNDVCVLVFAPGENFGLAGESNGVVPSAMNVTEEFVADVFHTSFAHIPAISSQRAQHDSSQEEEENKAREAHKAASKKPKSRFKKTEKPLQNKTENERQTC